MSYCIINFMKKTLRICGCIPSKIKFLIAIEENIQYKLESLTCPGFVRMLTLYDLPCQVMV